MFDLRMVTIASAFLRLKPSHLASVWIDSLLVASFNMESFFSNLLPQPVVATDNATIVKSCRKETRTRTGTRMGFLYLSLLLSVE